MQRTPSLQSEPRCISFNWELLENQNVKIEDNIEKTPVRFVLGNLMSRKVLTEFAHAIVLLFAIIGMTT